MTEQTQTINSDRQQDLQGIVEALLMAADAPLSIERLQQLLTLDPKPAIPEIRAVLQAIQTFCQHRAFELKEVANGWRFQVRNDYGNWVQKLWEERPPRYSRALLEILALIAYRQPITRAEIEKIRGVAVSTAIIKTLSEREWIRVVGHRDVPGKPALYATTKTFLSYFNLKNIEELPVLPKLESLEVFAKQLELENIQENTQEDIQENSQESG